MLTLQYIYAPCNMYIHVFVYIINFTYFVVHCVNAQIRNLYHIVLYVVLMSYISIQLETNTYDMPNSNQAFDVSFNLMLSRMELL